MLGASAGGWCGSSRLIPFGRPVVPDEYAAMHGGTKPKEAESPPPKRRSATGSPDRRRDDALTMGAFDLVIEADGFDERGGLAGSPSSPRRVRRPRKETCCARA